ncbi:MAG: DUF5615 family PIN-like protein [Spirochaetota bacterium]|nr:DUF5615 family PIN-like protein [Spirochaetota bacterium]
MNKQLRFLIDVSVGKKVEQYILDMGYDILCVRDINPKATDKEILHIAVNENRIVVTLDKDFGELVYNSGLVHSGVLLLRFEDEKANKKIEILQEILNKYSNQLEGNFCVYQNGRLRIKK